MNAIDAASPLNKQSPLGGRPEDLVNSSNRISSIARASICPTIGDVLKGLSQSKMFRAAIVTAATLSALFLLVSNPVGWLATVFGVSAFVAKFLFAGGVIGAFVGSLVVQAPLSGTLEFELSALARLGKAVNHNEIHCESWKKSDTAGKLFLGALPNRLRFSEGLHDVEKGAVLSLNEPWERNSHGVSIPPTEENWKELQVHYKKLDVLDHSLLSIETMDAAAEYINEHLQQGKNVYVHCRAGVGRSAIAVAAYLMKYGKAADGTLLSIETICQGIKASRERASIWEKLSVLVSYDQYLSAPELLHKYSALPLTAAIPRPQRSKELEAALCSSKSLKCFIQAKSSLIQGTGH